MNLQTFIGRVVSPLVLLPALAIVWLPPYFVSQDGPSLMYISSWFSMEQQPIHEYLQSNYHLQPNWVAPLLSGFLLNFFDGNTAEKVLATLYLIAFLLGAKALVSVIAGEERPKQSPQTDEEAIGNLKEIASASLGRPRNDGRYVTLSGPDSYRGEGWLLIAPLAIGQAFFKGFYNNNFSVAALLWFLYFYEKYKQNHGAKNLWICGGLMLFMFFSQPLPLLPLFALLGLDFLKRKDLRKPLLLVVLLPIVLLINWAINSQHEIPLWRPFMHQLGDLFKGDFLNSFGLTDQVFAYCFYLVLLIVFCILIWQEKSIKILNDSYFLVAVFLLLLYFVFPSNAAGGGLINIRLAMLFVIFMVLFFLKNIQAVKTLQLVSLAAGLLFLVFSFHLVKTEYKLSAEVEDMMVLGSDLKKGKRMVSGVNMPTKSITKFFYAPTKKIPILLHTNFELASKKGLVVFENHFGMVSYYPISYSKSKFNTDILNEYCSSISDFPYQYFLIWNFPYQDFFDKDFHKKSTLGRWTLYAK